MRRERRESRVFMPTSQDIQRACERIQGSWSERERKKRAGWTENGRWLPPLVEVDALLSEVSRTGDPQSY
jgi:hypothetical protein